MYIVDAFYSLDSGIMPWYTFLKSIGKDVNMYSYSVTRHILKIRKFRKSFEKWQYSILRSILIGPYLDTDQIELSTKFDKIWTFNVSIISGPNHYNPQHLRFFEIQGLSMIQDPAKIKNAKLGAKIGGLVYQFLTL